MQTSQRLLVEHMIRARESHNLLTFGLILSANGDLFFPDQLGHIASDLCRHLGVESFLSSGRPLAQLTEKLIDLTACQRLTLADALEQAWHRGMKQENKSPKEFFATLGIDLT